MHLSPDQEDALREIFNIGIGRAAATLSELIGTRIEMAVPRVALYALDLPGDPLASAADIRDVVIIQDFRGDLTGRSALLLPQASGLRLAHFLGEVAEPVDELDLEMCGILTEVGNIMLNSVLGALANIIKAHLDYSVPSFYSSRPLGLLLSPITHDQCKLIVADADFWVRRDSIRGSLLVVLGTSRLEVLLDALCKVGA